MIMYSMLLAVLNGSQQQPDDKHVKLTRLVIVYALVETESRVTKFVELVRIFDVVANLVVDDPCGVDETCQREVALLPNGVAVTRDVVESNQTCK